MSGSAGFTLLEILVSFAIIGITLTLVMQLFSGSLRSGAISRGYGQAVLLADRKMNEILEESETPDEKGFSESGDFNDGYSWEVAVTPYEEFIPEEDSFPLQLYRIEVTVYWGLGDSKRHITLSAIKSFEAINRP
jgi:general secretion pathway protein I